MARVECEIELADLTNDAGFQVQGVKATCSKCGHVTESFGTSEASVRRCLALMRDECPQDEVNYYVGELE